MNMTKISISGYAKMISDSIGDEADAILLLRINGNGSQFSIIGLDEHMISPTAIQMAIALQRLLNTDMSAAVKIGTTLQKIGLVESNEAQRVTSELKREEVPFFKPEPEDEQEKEQHIETYSHNSDSEPSRKEMLREIANALIDAMFGGEDHEDDH